jgi:cysteine desulfurase/selenocysteine lyase
MSSIFNPEEIQSDFPILQQQVHGKKLVYLDNAATSQKPNQVIDAISNYYRTSNANVHRGVHALSDASTDAWTAARKTIATFFDADDQELIVTRNTTEGVNGIAYGWGYDAIAEGDVILTTALEHHSNFVVWQRLAEKNKAHLEIIEIDAEGRIHLDDLQQKLEKFGSRVTLVTLVHVSNTLGVEQDLESIVSLVKNKSKAKILVDVAQSAPHKKLSFKKLHIDFAVFSGHKMLGPMGFGGLLIRKALLQNEEVQPWLFGGGMISSVLIEKTELHPDIDERFTAGTPDVASAVGMAAACEYLSELGMENVEAHDRELVAYALEKLAAVQEIEVIGPKTQENRLGSVAFVHRTVHAHDVAQILDSQGIAVRSGHHCTMPLHKKFNWQATVRASFQVYTSKEDIDALVTGLAKVSQVFG